MADCLQRRVVCLVGATGGIGSATARLFASDAGTSLICMDRSEVSPDVLAREIGATAHAIDVTNETSVNSAFDAARKVAPQLDVLVITAGIVENESISSLTLDRWHAILGVNLTGSFLVAKAALPWLVDGGRIIFLASLAGRTGGVLTGPAYAASKGGVESLAKALARELAPRRITVNCVAPGAVETAMILTHTPERRAAMVAGTPLRRMAAPDEIAATIGFLAGKSAGFITGAVVPVNGGVRMD